MRVEEVRRVPHLLEGGGHGALRLRFHPHLLLGVRLLPVVVMNVVVHLEERRGGGVGGGGRGTREGGGLLLGTQEY